MKKKILIIEDEEDLVKGLKLNLADEGYELDWAPDGTEGLRKALEELTEVYINDLRGFYQQRKARKGEITVVEKELEKMLESVFLLLQELDG